MAQADEGGVRLVDLEPPQLVQVRRSLEQEREQFTLAFTQLRSAQSKFLSGLGSLKTIGSKKIGDAEHQILIPLTSSLYVPGRIVDQERVLVDVGTGFYIDKTLEEARLYYQDKVDHLRKEMEKIKTLVGEREQNLQMVSQVMQMKAQRPVEQK